MSKRFGFTLAEVLITLGIIGVVAAMTIPTLMNNVQNNEFKAQMKKEYSVLNNAFQQLATENGGQFVYALANNSGTQGLLLKNTFKQKLSYIKECDTNDGTNLNICFPSQASVKYLNNTGAGGVYLGNDTTVGLVLKDGSSLAFGGSGSDSATSNCTGTRGNAGYTNSCGYVLVDTNGIKPPNTWGRDLYVFFIFSDRLRPSSVDTVESVVTTVDDCQTGTNHGITCSSKYLTGN